MNSSVHRTALAIAGMAVVATIAVALIADGYLSAHPLPAAQPAAQVAAPTDQAPETIYVKPAPSPSVIHVVQQAPPAGSPPVIHVTVPGGGEHEDGHESGGDD